MHVCVCVFGVQVFEPSDRVSRLALEYSAPCRAWHLLPSVLHRCPACAMMCDAGVLNVCSDRCWWLKRHPCVVWCCSAPWHVNNVRRSAHRTSSVVCWTATAHLVDAIIFILVILFIRDLSPILRERRYTC